MPDKDIKEKNPTVPHQEHRESLNHNTGGESEFLVVEAALSDLGTGRGEKGRFHFLQVCFH